VVNEWVVMRSAMKTNGCDKERGCLIGRTFQYDVKEESAKIEQRYDHAVANDLAFMKREFLRRALWHCTP
jgi:hypothetical protein